MTRSLIYILGTSRPQGNTRQFLDCINQSARDPVIDLGALNISYFDYAHQNRSDDFIPVIEQVTQHQIIGLVSPVYWYTVSAQLKTFLDRWSDLLANAKPLGRALRGKDVFLAATGAECPEIPECMEETLRLSAEYMGMHYRGSVYAKMPNDGEIPPGAVEAAERFIADLKRP